MLLIPNALCWSCRKCNCTCALPAEVQLRLRVTRRSWQKLFAGKNFVKILVTALMQLRSYSEQQRAFRNSNICNWALTAETKISFRSCWRSSTQIAINLPTEAGPYSVRQFFLIGKYSISGSISYNALYYYFGNLVVVLHAKLFFSLLLLLWQKQFCFFFNNLYSNRHWLKVLDNIWWNENIFIDFLCFKKKPRFTCMTKLINC